MSGNMFSTPVARLRGDDAQLGGDAADNAGVAISRIGEHGMDSCL